MKEGKERKMRRGTSSEGRVDRMDGRGDGRRKEERRRAGRREGRVGVG